MNRIYLWFKWLLQVALNLLAKYLINWPLAPVIVLFADENGWLPDWLWWFQTPDNSLNGDKGWQRESRPFLIEDNSFKRWVNRFRWLHRNALYGLAEAFFSVRYDFESDTLVTAGNPAVTNGPDGLSGLVKRYLYRNGRLIAFQYYWIRQWRCWPTKCIRVSIGWKLWGFDKRNDTYASLAFSPSPFMKFTPKGLHGQ